jgi:ABC-2 type transport system permease protein/oleandomycin transport system permease protein
MTTQTRSISQDVTNQMRDTTVMIKRNLLRIIRLPQLLFFSSVQPIIFLLLFTFVFGGAITRGTDISYIDFLLPGVLVQTAVFGSTQTAIGLTEDLAAGVIDRFRSLPMARSAVLAGRTTADLVRNAAVTVIMLTVGTIIGYRIGGTVIEAALGVVIALLFGFSVSWAMASLGLWVKNAETAQTASFVIIFPLVFASSIFVPPASMPSWLQGFAANQPVSVVASTVRALMGGLPVGSRILESAMWIAAILAVFFPLGVHLYRRAVST